LQCKCMTKDVIYVDTSCAHDQQGMTNLGIKNACDQQGITNL